MSRDGRRREEIGGALIASSRLNNIKDAEGMLNRLVGHINKLKKSVNSVSNEIVERTQNYLATHGMKAANNLVTALDEDGTTPKGELRLKAAESLLNRIGIGSRETVDHNVTAIHGVVLLPNKQEEKIIEG